MALDVAARRGRRLEAISSEILDEVLAKLAAVFERPFPSQRSAYSMKVISSTSCAWLRREKMTSPTRKLEIILRWLRCLGDPTNSIIVSAVTTRDCRSTYVSGRSGVIVRW